LEATTVLKSVGNNIKDAAEYLDDINSSTSNKRFTWFIPQSIDSKDNSGMKARYDRIYYTSESLRPLQLDIIGEEEIIDRALAQAIGEATGDAATYLTPSDHRGLVLTFMLPTLSNSSSSSSSSSSSVLAPQFRTEVDSLPTVVMGQKRGRDAIESSSSDSTMNNDDSPPPKAADQRRKLFLDALAKRSIQ